MELSCFAATPAAAVRHPNSKPFLIALRPTSVPLLSRRMPIGLSNPEIRFPVGRLVRASEFEEVSYSEFKGKKVEWEVETESGEEQVEKTAYVRQEGEILKEEAGTAIEFEEAVAGAPEGEVDVLSIFKNFDPKKLSYGDAYPILLYGTGAFVVLWVSSAVVGALDALPLIPKFLEIVGLGYTVWFSYRYLVFKKNRDELSAKLQDLREQIMGASDW